MIQFHDDPTLEELLRDPITQAIMAADRVDPRRLEAMLQFMAGAIGSRSGASAAALLDAVARFDRGAVGEPSRPSGGLRDTACGHGSGSRIRPRQSSRRSGAQ
jgi:hypothetical protein